MRKNLKVRSQDPVDVGHLQKLTAEEREAQHCDPRSAIAEKSADPKNPLRVSEDTPHLGGRRLFLHLFNALHEQVPRVRKSRLQKPNLKALHLHSAVFHWRRARDLYISLTNTNEGFEEVVVEEIAMDFMEATVASVYSTVSTIEVFSQEVIFEKSKGKTHKFDKTEGLANILRDKLPELTNKTRPTQTKWWNDFQNIHRARNSFTHAGMKEQESEEMLARAWDALLKPNLDPPDVARRIIRHFSDAEPNWIPEVIEHAQTRAKRSLLRATE
ncbi:MAG: hypothetical protein OXC69_08325 [Candidatus Tectomicrobia bacterium]|nr:hypothetical protein [Candidatus Tectomicrobia bacterium]